MECCCCALPGAHITVDSQPCEAQQLAGAGCCPNRAAGGPLHGPLPCRRPPGAEPHLWPT